MRGESVCVDAVGIAVDRPLRDAAEIDAGLLSESRQCQIQWAVEYFDLGQSENPVVAGKFDADVTSPWHGSRVLQRIAGRHCEFAEYEVAIRETSRSSVGEAVVGQSFQPDCSDARAGNIGDDRVRIGRRQFATCQHRAIIQYRQRCDAGRTALQVAGESSIAGRLRRSPAGSRPARWRTHRLRGARRKPPRAANSAAAGLGRELRSPSAARRRP